MSKGQEKKPQKIAHKSNIRTSQDLHKEEANTIEKMEEELSYLEYIIANVPGHVYWLDKNNVYLGCNDEHAKTAGLKSRKEVVGKTNLDMLWREQAEILDNLNQLVMNTGKPHVKEESVTINGVYRTYLSKKVPLRNKNNEIVGILCISIDITERKEMEKALVEAQAQVKAQKATESANYIMTEFISNMGHDLTTPLSDIGGVAELFKIYSDEYPELRDLIEALVNRYAACEKVRDRIVDATSLSNLEVKYQTFSITQVLLDLEKELKPSISTKNLKMILHPFKPKKEDVIETDYEKFKAILFEFISNAINFTEEGQVAISVEKRDNLFQIKVSDTGIGIPSDKFDYIFQQYTKLSRSNKYGANFKGVGAGLYLAKIRANILNASISVESEVNKGSTFTLSIPAHPIKNL